jgi:hypothetical protein
MYNKFEINPNYTITEEEFQDSKIYYVDNFYKYPDELVSHLLTSEPPKLWKEHDTPSYNGVHFLDYRHAFKDTGVEYVGDELANICKQHYVGINRDIVVTNCTKFLDKDFNDYKNYYWLPHIDFEGYIGIIYLNPTTNQGTNLYEQLEDDSYDGPEHYQPWRSKHKYKLIKTLEGTFNRVILFDAGYFLHGMSVDSDDFFNIFRLNQVLFFNP